MFHDEFFPTPKALIKQMADPYFKRNTRDDRDEDNLKTVTILDPSAGKGDILEYVKENYFGHWRSSMIQPYAIEISKDLQYILQEKNFRVIESDFLQYNGDYYFDLILMNPPFSTGDKHLLHAWEILKTGNICCLLNSETIRNPHTESRKLLAKIIEDHGSIEHIGQAFKKAERPTEVEVCIVRLKKKETEGKFNYTFKQVSKEEDRILTDEKIRDKVATTDTVGNMMLQFENLKSAYVEYLKAVDKMHFYKQGLHSQYFSFGEMITKFSSTNQQSYNVFCDQMKSEIWRTVIDKLDIQKYMTSQVRKDFATFCQHQGCLDFTKENVSELINMIFINRYTILDNAIVEVFEYFTRYHKENRCYVEGWKTNDRYKTNRKIILPRWVRYGEYMNSYDLRKDGDTFKTNFSYTTEMGDIDKVMAYLTGSNYDEITHIETALKRKFEILGNVAAGTFDNECESEFFRMRFFKKGTLHLEFKDERLWQEFNMRACAGKNWLPEGELKKWQASKEPAPNPVTNQKLIEMVTGDKPKSKTSELLQAALF